MQLTYDIKPPIKEFKTREIKTHNFDLEDTIQMSYPWKIERKIETAQRIIDLREIKIKPKEIKINNFGLNETIHA